MAKNLAAESAPFDLLNVPEHIQQTELSKSLTTTQSIMVPRIVFNGKGSWEMKLGSESQRHIESKDLNVIIVGVAPHVSRAFYEDAYSPGFAKPPVCWSADSIKPSHAITDPQADTCAECQKNIKAAGGSKPCRFFRRIAVVSPDDITGQIYQMQLPATTIFPQTEGTNMAFNGYVKFLNSKNTPIDRVVTQMYFDEGVSYGKLFFTAVEFVSEEDTKILETLADAPEIQEAITTSYASKSTEDAKSPTGFVAAKAAPTPTGSPEEKPVVKTRTKKPVAPLEEAPIGEIMDKWTGSAEVDDE
tara:strand:- start:976 stop:1881 length:906 start_codon:yes stop_codon:yes gene_type:complete